MTQFLELPAGWDPALAHQIRRTGAYRRPDGVGVPVYNYLFDRSNAGERLFRTLLVEVTAFINAKIRENGHAFDLHEVEVATNVLAEGADRVLVLGDPEARFSSFGNLGIDTFMENYASLKPWLPQKLIRAVEACSVSALESVLGARYMQTLPSDLPWKICYTPEVRGTGLLTEKFMNELGQEYYTMGRLDMELGMYANAAMFAWTMAQASRDIEGFAGLPREARFFWATMYFNSGAGNGRKLLRQHGVGYYKQSLDPSIRERRQSAQYHALKRVSSMGFLLRTVYAR